MKRLKINNRTLQLIQIVRNIIIQNREYATVITPPPDYLLEQIVYELSMGFIKHKNIYGKDHRFYNYFKTLLTNVTDRNKIDINENA